MKKQLLLLVIILLPMVASADNSGFCGDNVIWTYVEATKTLTISGTGDMTDYASLSSPWYYFREDIEKVIVDNGVTSLGNAAFKNCSKLTSITIPNGVTKIGAEALSECSSLASISIPASVANIGQAAFSGCSTIGYIFFPENVTEVSERVCDGCKSLTDLKLSNNTKEIGTKAFNDCSSLKFLVIPSSVETINQLAFADCSSLSKAKLLSKTPSLLYDNSFTNHSFSLKVPKGCKAAYQSAQGWKNFTDISDAEESGICGDNLKWNFDDTSMTLIISGIGAMTNYYYDEAPWYFIHQIIQHIVLEDGVTTIGNDAFFDCISLSTVTIPNSVTSIGEWALEFCSALPSVIIPNSVTSIGEYAFFGCSSISSITIPNSVTSIGRSTFYGCSNLTFAVVSKNLTKIDPSAFFKCEMLRDFYCYADNVPTTSFSPFELSIIENATLHVPSTSIYIYKAVEPWKNFKEIVALSTTDPQPTKIESSVNEATVTTTEYYNICGKRLISPQRGLNIIRMRDGKTKKVVIK